MAKAKKGGSADSGNKKTRIGQIILAVVVVGAVIAAFVLRNQGSSSGGDTAQGNDNTADMLKDTAPLRNRLVLPAKPQTPRPVTLSPGDFPDPDIKTAYQAAKDTPEALEHVACYCGCFGTSGHRNNLDCFKDQHGATWGLCRAIALEAQKEFKAGTPIEQIKRNVDERWAPPATP